MLTSRLHLVLIASLAAATLLAAAAPSWAQEEATLIAVLKSADASQKDKADACRELARVGTKAAVPALAALLGDEKLSHMARYGLETIPDASVDDALRAALGSLKGRPLVGVIGSIGVRHDAQAVEPLAKLLGDGDADVAQGAARALGKIGTPQAAKALLGALADVPPANLVAFCEGLFRCAESLAAKGQKDQALAIYDRLRKLPGPHQVRTGALRGSILLRQKEGLPLLLEALRGEDYALAAAAVRTSMEMPGADVTEALAGELPKLPADKQVLVIQDLGTRGDAAAAPAIMALAGNGPAAVRLAAIRSLTELGYGPAVAMLAELALGGDADLAAPARQLLGSFPGKEGDAAIVAMLNHKDVKARCLAVELIGQRDVAGVIPALLKAAADPDETVRLASLRALRDQGGVADLPALLDLLVKARAIAEMQAAEAAVGALCARQSGPVTGSVVIQKAVYGDLPAGQQADVTKKVAELVKAGAVAVEASNGNFGDTAQGTPKRLRVDYTVNGTPSSKTVAENDTLTLTASTTSPACVDKIVAACATAPAGAKAALVRVLRLAGGPKSLETVRAAASDTHAEVQDAAYRALCDWPTADALPAVAQLAKNPPNATIKILALRGYIRLAAIQDAPPATKLESLQDALALAKRSEEKRLVLSALGSVAVADSLALVAKHLDDPALKEEACLAAVAIAERIVQSHPAQVAKVMQQVAKATDNKALAGRAAALANRAKKTS